MPTRKLSKPTKAAKPDTKSEARTDARRKPASGQPRMPAAQRREQLLDAAAALFAKSGYARATTAELAKAAGVTEPIIYRHFASKRDLFIALIDRSAKGTLSFWDTHLKGATDPAQRLLRLLADNPMVSPSGREDYLVLLQAITEVDDPLIREAVMKHMVGLHAFIVREIAHAQEEHKVPTRFSAEIIGWLLIHLGMGYGVLTALKIPGLGEDANRAHVQDVIARLLVGRAGERKPEEGT